jgi:hypothetical protein
MTGMGFGKTVFARRGLLETLGCGSVGFYFRHRFTPLIHIYNINNLIY